MSDLIAIDDEDEPTARAVTLTYDSSGALVEDVDDDDDDDDGAAALDEVNRYVTWTDERALEHAGLLKIDVEGYEPDVIRGADRLLRERRIGTARSRHPVTSALAALPGYSTFQNRRLLEATIGEAR